MVYCSYCGEQLSDGTMFCIKCGKKVVGEVPQGRNEYKETSSKLASEGSTEEIDKRARAQREYEAVVLNRANNKETGNRVQAQSGKYRTILKTGILATVILLISWSIMSFYSHSQQKKDFIVFYKNTHNAMRQLDSITAGIQDERKAFYSNREDNRMAGVFGAKASKSQIELKKIRSVLEAIETPASFTAIQKEDAQAVIIFCINIIENELIMLDCETNYINLIQSGKKVLANQALNRIDQEPDNIERYRRLANARFSRMIKEFDIVEADVN